MVLEMVSKLPGSRRNLQVMEPNFVLNLAISILIFAPGLFLLAIAFFVGILAALERCGLFSRLDHRA